VGRAPAEATLESGFLDEVPVFLRIVLVVAVGNEIAEVPGVVVAFALLVVLRIILGHVIFPFT
jgi:hypothetical protein